MFKHQEYASLLVYVEYVDEIFYMINTVDFFGCITVSIACKQYRKFLCNDVIRVHIHLLLFCDYFIVKDVGFSQHYFLVVDLHEVQEIIILSSKIYRFNICLHMVFCCSSIFLYFLSVKVLL